MAEITNELMYETLKAIRGDLSQALAKIDALAAEQRAMKGHLAALVQSVLNREGPLVLLEAVIWRSRTL